MRTGITITTTMTLLVFASLTAHPQGNVSAPVPEPSIFSQLFSRYTGLNGYEDLIMAADLVRGDKALQAAQDEGATLADKRRALDDRNVSEALRYLRAGLNKEIHSPRDPDKMDENTTFPELAQFRNLARTLAMEQYVSLSEGRVSKALDAMRDGLRLGYVVQGDTIISGLVGIAVDAIALNEVARRYDEFSVHDCTQAIAAAREWLEFPNPALSVLLNEHRLNIRLLQEARNDIPRLQKMLDDGTDPNEPAASEGQLAHQELTDYIAGHPGAAAGIVDQAVALSNAEFNATMAELKKPAWERKPFPKRPIRATMADRLNSSFTPNLELIIDKYMIEVARVHLLGAHAAIHRYKWEHKRLPGSLEDLKMSDLTTDPYTGKPLIYKVTGGTYEMYSVGGFVLDDNGQASAAQRSAIYLPRLNGN